VPIQAPGRVQVNVAPNVFADPDIAFNDMSEQLFVKNLSGHEVVWRYAKREWTLPAKGKQVAVPLMVCCKYLGDPRSAFGVTNQFTIPGEQRPGTIPERYSELRRLSILYGIYEGHIERMSAMRYRDIPGDRNDPDRVLFPDKDPDQTIVPKVEVTTLDGKEVRFPIYDPESHPYKYETEVTGMIDLRTELEKLQRQVTLANDRIEAINQTQAEEGEIPPAQEDRARPPVG
jgi:hypothetical protein